MQKQQTIAITTMMHQISFAISQVEGSNGIIGGGGAGGKGHGGGGLLGGGGVGGGWGGAAGGSSHQNLHAIVALVSHDDEPVAVDGDAATRVEELPVA
jgi:hypothetical protein